MHLIRKSFVIWLLIIDTVYRRKHLGCEERFGWLGAEIVRVDIRALNCTQEFLCEWQLCIAIQALLYWPFHSDWAFPHKVQIVQIKNMRGAPDGAAQYSFAGFKIIMSYDHATMKLNDNHFLGWGNFIWSFLQTSYGTLALIFLGFLMCIWKSLFPKWASMNRFSLWIEKCSHVLSTTSDLWKLQYIM